MYCFLNWECTVYVTASEIIFICHMHIFKPKNVLLLHFSKKKVSCSYQQWSMCGAGLRLRMVISKILSDGHRNDVNLHTLHWTKSIIDTCYR